MTAKNKDIISEMPASRPIIFYEENCIGCGRCVDICQVDVFLPNPDQSLNTPLVAFPGECWYCGNCVVVCPADGAIELRHPLMNQAHWIEKSTLLKRKENK